MDCSEVLTTHSTTQGERPARGMIGKMRVTTKVLMVATVVAMVVASGLPALAQEDVIPECEDNGGVPPCVVDLGVPCPPGSVPDGIFLDIDPGQTEGELQQICLAPTQPEQQQPQPQQSVCPPVSQELGNEAESGDVSPSFGVTSTGDSSNQTAAPLQFGNSGSLQNAQGVLQSCGSVADDAELSGGSMEISPALNAPSTQGVGESSASQQG